MDHSVSRIDRVIKEAQELSQDELVILLRKIQTLVKQKAEASGKSTSEVKTHNIRQFRGIAANDPIGEDPTVYIRRLRDEEWD